MADRKGMMEIEDVLSSIRRLVAADTRPAAAAGASGQAPDAAERLVLTPAQRIDEEEVEQADTPAAGTSESLRAWEEDSRADRGLGEMPKDAPEEDIEATLAALEAELDSDLSAGTAETYVQDLAGDAFPAEPGEVAQAADWDDAAEAPELDGATAAAEDFALTDPAPGAFDPADLPGAGGWAAAEPGEEVAEDWAEGVATEAMPAPAALAEPDEDPAGEPPAGIAAPASRSSRSGFIWEGGFDDAAVPDLPDAPTGLSDLDGDADDFATPAEAADPEIDDPELAEPVDAAARMPAEMPSGGDEPEGTMDSGYAMRESFELVRASELVHEVAEPSEPEEVTIDADAGYADAWPDAQDPSAEPDEPATATAPAAPAFVAAGDFAFDAEPGDTEEELAGAGLFDAEDGLPLDEAALRDLVAEVLRDELRGPLGARIARNLRQMVRQELARELAARGLSDES